MTNADEPEVTIQILAAKAIKWADGNVQSATIRMCADVMGDTKLYRRLMDPLVREACYSVIRAQCRMQKRAVWSAPQPSAGEHKRRIGLLADGTHLTLMDYFRLPGGTRLGDATKAELIAASAFYMKQGRDMVIKGQWLWLVSRAVPENKTVRAALTDKQLKSLRARAENQSEMLQAAE